MRSRQFLLSNTSPLSLLLFLLLCFHVLVPYVITAFTIPSGDIDNPSRLSGKSKFHNQEDNMPDFSLPQILEDQDADTTLIQHTSTSTIGSSQEYRRHRYNSSKRMKVSHNNTKHDTIVKDEAFDAPVPSSSTMLQLNQNCTVPWQRSELAKSTHEYRRHRYTISQRKLSFDNTKHETNVKHGALDTPAPTSLPGLQLNQNSTVSLKLSELSEWANQGNGYKSEAILIRLEENGTAPRNAYLATIRAWLSTDQVNKALAVMARLERSKFRVKAADYRPILQAMIRTGQPDEAIRLLNHMAKCNTGRPILKNYDFDDPKRRKFLWNTLSCSETPDERCLMIVCNEFVKKRLPERLKVVRGIYEWAKEHQRADNYLFNIALGAFDNPREAEIFLLLHADPNTHSICYMTVIQAYFKHNYVHQRGKKMESILRRIESVSPGGTIQPDLVTYRQIMNAYLGDKEGLQSARFLKKSCKDVMTGRIKDSQHSSQLFLSWSKCVIDDVAKGCFEATGERAIFDVIQSLEQFFHFKGETLSIDFYHFVMDNYIRAKGAQSIPFVESLFSQIRSRYIASRNPDLEPSTKTVNIVLKAYSKSMDVSIMEKGERLLTRMEEIYSRGKDLRQCIVPDVVSYTTVIQGWASCRSPDAILRADQVAKRLNQMYKSGNEAAKADRGVVLALLNANIWSGQAQKIFRTSCDLMDQTSMLALVNATTPDMVSLSKLVKDMKSSDVGEKAEEIIDLLLARYKDSRNEDVLPDAQLFTSAISAWGRSRRSYSAVKAERILDKMMLLFDLTKSEKMKPNVHHFLAVMRAYAQPNQPDKAQNAKRIFDQMIALYEDGLLDDAPSRDTFTAVLKACTHTKGISREKKRELEICQTIYDMISSCKYCSHNEATYGAYIGAIRNCMERGEERTRVLSLAFDRCASEGFVDTFILGQLRRSVSLAEFKDIVGKNLLCEKTVLDIDDCPKYWLRNVVNRTK